MGAFLELTGTVLAAAVLAVLLWWQVGRLLRPLPAPGVKIAVPGRGDGEQLEQTLRALYWLRGMGLLRGAIVIETEELTPAGRMLAAELVRRYPAAELR